MPVIYASSDYFRPTAYQRFTNKSPIVFTASKVWLFKSLVFQVNDMNRALCNCPMSQTPRWSQRRLPLEFLQNYFNNASACFLAASL
jgi:hypothetical protein